MRCVCGCGRRAVQRHHAFYQQCIRRIVLAATRDQRERTSRIARLLSDQRNIVWLAHDCHGRHHSRARPLELRLLPSGVFEFGVELMGAGAAYEYLRRRYAGDDVRLDQLLEEADHGV